MRILLTGAAGFVGRNVLKELERKGHTVVCVDLYADRKIGGSKWIVGDLAKMNWNKIEKVDGICHVGAAVNQGKSKDEIEACLQTNIIGTTRLVQWAMKKKITRFVYTSSAGLYSRPAQKLPVNEEARIETPNGYLLSKLYGEILLKKREIQKIISVIALRLSSPYGPGQNTKSVLSIFIRNVVSDEPIKIFGTGNRSQDFIGIFDVAEAHVKALEISSSPGFSLINLGSGQETSLNQLAREILKVFGNRQKGIIEHISDSSHENDRFFLDLNKMKKVLGIHPKRISEGLKLLKPSMLDYMRTR
jgi:nucleoside-diphosphate-sugar epimerase